MGKKESYTCDICGKPCTLDDHIDDLQVIFTTEQTEGRSVEPHLCSVDLYVCDACKEHLLEGNYLFASGAQGHNTYHFPKKKK